MSRWPLVSAWILSQILKALTARERMSAVSFLKADLSGRTAPAATAQRGEQMAAESWVPTCVCERLALANGLVPSNRNTTEIHASIHASRDPLIYCLRQQQQCLQLLTEQKPVLGAAWETKSRFWLFCYTSRDFWATISLYLHPVCFHPCLWS